MLTTSTFCNDFLAHVYTVPGGSWPAKTVFFSFQYFYCYSQNFWVIYVIFYVHTKSLAYKHKDLSLNPKNACKRWIQHLSITPVLRPGWRVSETVFLDFVMDGFGCQPDTPGRRDSQLGNSLHQTGLWASMRHFLDCWVLWEGQVLWIVHPCAGGPVV